MRHAVLCFSLLIGCAGTDYDDVGSVEQALPPIDNCETNPCCNPSPIIIDVAGDGFAMTDAENGVRFDMNANGVLERLSWAAPGSDDAWLVLDRNGNGFIDDGGELFGNFTAQPDSQPRHGYHALAVFDENGDDVIDANDPIFSSLRLWQDLNHDGVSQDDELSNLGAFGISGLELTVKTLMRTDEYGNVFRYGAKLIRAQGSAVGPKSYDVFLRRGGGTTSQNEGTVASTEAAISAPAWRCKGNCLWTASYLGALCTKIYTEATYTGDPGSSKELVCDIAKLAAQLKGDTSMCRLFEDAITKPCVCNPNHEVESFSDCEEIVPPPDPLEC
jgi:hypothetical protein